METLQNLLDSSTVPALTALLLGLLTAISPCPLATNIAAMGYLAREVGNRRRIFVNGLLYTAGRILAYTLLGAACIALLRSGGSTFAVQRFIGGWTELLVGALLLLTGLFMLFGDRLRLPGFGFTRGDERLKGRGGTGALLLGALFALVFCPTSGVLYFGMLIPMAAAETGGYLLPALFALATGIPVVAAAWLLAFGAAGIGRFYNRMQSIRKWLNRAVALLFIATGVYYLVVYFI